MKKVLLSILMFFYLASFSGIAMDIHYCMGKKVGMGFLCDDKDKCGKCGMKAKKSCCSNQYKFYKLSDTHNSVSNTIQLPVYEVPEISHSVVYNWPMVDNGYQENTRNNSPPDVSGHTICVLNCVFRL